MRVRFVSKGGLSDYRQEDENADITLLGFSALGEVSYEKELAGETHFFEECAKRSKQDENILVCGCVTNSRGHRRKSAVVAENGKLSGVSDMLYALDGGYGSGAELRIYPTKAGKMGVLVGEDLYFHDTVRAMSLCGADFIACVFGEVKGELPLALIRARAFELGAPIFLCGQGYAAIATPEGEIAFASPQSPICAELSWKTEYHLVEKRLRRQFPE